MSAINGSNSSGDLFSITEISLPRVARFWLLLLFNVPSVICSLGLIVHIITSRTRRHALQNHTILAILIFGLPVQLIDITFYLIFYQYNSFLPYKPVVCLIWWFVDIGIYDGGLILLAWLAVERHILIFYDRRLRNRRGRFLFHYLPLIILVIYILLFFISVIFFLPCENTYDYTLPACGASAGYQSYGALGTWDYVINLCAPILVETIASISLIARVQWQKRRLCQSNQWRKQRRMIIQLLLVSTLNISVNLGTSIIPLAHMCGLPSEYGYQVSLYFYFFGYFVYFLFPFASLSQFPDLRKNIKRKICASVLRPTHRRATVVPTVRGIPMVRPT